MSDTPKSDAPKKEKLSPWSVLFLVFLALILIGGMAIPSCSEGLGQGAENTFMHRPAIEWNISMLLRIAISMAIVGVFVGAYFLKKKSDGGGAHH